MIVVPRFSSVRSSTCCNRCCRCRRPSCTRSPYVDSSTSQSAPYGGRGASVTARAAPLEQAAVDQQGTATVRSQLVTGTRNPVKTAVVDQLHGRYPDELNQDVGHLPKIRCWWRMCVFRPTPPLLFPNSLIILDFFRLSCKVI